MSIGLSLLRFRIRVSFCELQCNNLLVTTRGTADLIGSSYVNHTSARMRIKNRLLYKLKHNSDRPIQKTYFIPSEIDEARRFPP